MKEALCNALEGANKRNREYREQIERLQKQLESDEMALTESQEIIAELKAQLNEANELISVLFPLSMNKERALERTTEYVKKYNIS